MQLINSREQLIIDLYELTMAAGYFEQNHNPEVCFELFIRDLPEQRNFLMAAGLERVLDYIENLTFSLKQVDYLRSLPNFKHISDAFFDYLNQFQFSGHISAVPEGTVVFANEPLVQVQAPLIEAQIVETFLLSEINFQTMVASKAARVVFAANMGGKQRGVMEFGSRRAHGAQAGVLAARASYIAGFIGTSNVLAGHLYSIPLYGTTAHSWTMAFNSEREAFEKYYQKFKEDAIFLVDTYDTQEGIKNAMAIAEHFRGIRIDSGDLSKEAKMARQLLDKNGFNDVMIVLSSDLNEYKIAEMVENKTPVDAFGVGTQVATSTDAPTLQGVYKLVELRDREGRHYRAKFSPDKITLPGRKQIWRFVDAEGRAEYDLIALFEEDFSDEAEPLLRPYIRNGKRIVSRESLEAIRKRAKANLEQLPNELRQLHTKSAFDIRTSNRLQTLLHDIREEIQNNDGNFDG